MPSKRKLKKAVKRMSDYFAEELDFLQQISSPEHYQALNDLISGIYEAEESTLKGIANSRKATDKQSLYFKQVVEKHNEKINKLGTQFGELQDIIFSELQNMVSDQPSDTKQGE